MRRFFTLVAILFIYLVNDAVFLSFLGVHEEVAVHVFGDLVELLPGGFGHHFVEAFSGLDDVS